MSFGFSTTDGIEFIIIKILIHTMLLKYSDCEELLYFILTTSYLFTSLYLGVHSYIDNTVGII